MKKMSMVFCVLALSACTTLNKNQPSAPIDASVKADLKADITVDMTKKIKGQASSTMLFGLLEIGGPDKFADGVFASATGSILSFGGTDGVKSAAAYNALRGTNVDVIVAPQYIIEKKNYLIFSTTKAVVTGYAGTIKKIQ